MKLIILSLLFCVQSAFAFKRQTVCEDPIKETMSELVCSGKLYSLLKSSVKKVDLDAAQAPSVDYLELGFPDDSTSIIYNYNKGLYSSSNKLLGYLQIMGITNSEMRVKIQFNIYFDVQGRVLGAFENN